MPFLGPKKCVIAQYSAYNNRLSCHWHTITHLFLVAENYRVWKVPLLGFLSRRKAIKFAILTHWELALDQLFLSKYRIGWLVVYGKWCQGVKKRGRIWRFYSNTDGTFMHDIQRKRDDKKEIIFVFVWNAFSEFFFLNSRGHTQGCSTYSSLENGLEAAKCMSNTSAILQPILKRLKLKEQIKVFVVAVIIKCTKAHVKCKHLQK